MSRTIGSNGPKTMEAILNAGLTLIYRHGYAAMSLRQLAAEVGIQVGSLYNHISTKQDLLFLLLQTHMNTLLQALDEALAPAASPEGALRAFAAFHVMYHITRKEKVFISYSELRSLEAENYEAIAARRTEYERRLVTILNRGKAEGVFHIEDVPATTYAILAMLTGVCTWYNPAGRLTPAALTAIHTDLALKAAGVSYKAHPR